MGKVTSSWIVQNACRGKCEDFYYPVSDYRALEAENNELKQEIKDREYSEKCVTKTLHDALDERDDLQAKLAALVVAANCITKKYFDEKAILHMVDFEYLKAAIAAAEKEG